MEGNDKEFTFKQFKVKHGKNSLPITTEALIFGAFLADQIKNEKLILEIGSGCGILPLMIAQKSKSYIESVEIDKNAFELACENVKNSIFSNQIGIFHTDIQSFGFGKMDIQNKNYDLIFSNPPFFKNHLKSKKATQNIAKHNDSLPFDILAKNVGRLLSQTGQFRVLLPPYEMSLLKTELLHFGLNKNQEILIHSSQNSKVLRIIATFAYQSENFRPIHFFIKDTENEYSNQFKDLLKDYYLIF
jgi:tRNA1Val (adenine37-N6)-methyltransferase